MKRSLLIRLAEFFSRFSNKPKACFETSGPDDQGRVEFAISFNQAFIKNLHTHGFGGVNDDETVQQFFLSARMLPEHLLDDEDTVNPSATPNLSNEANTLRR